MATWAVEVQILVPLTTYWLPRRSALVLSLVVLSPASGSVTPKQALSSPRISGGSMRRFCASLPKTTTGSRPKMFMWIEEAPVIAAPDSATACIMIAASVMPSPLPP